MVRSKLRPDHPLILMDIADSITLDLAGIAMTIYADAACLPGLLRLARAWASCHVKVETLACQAEIFAFQEAATGQVVVSAGTWREQDEFGVSDCHLALERALYAELSRLLPENSQMLHAGAVVTQKQGFLFVGPSGAGKSSLCLAAMQRGALYLSDDILTTDGQVLRGVARAIQFDPPKIDSPFPGWLETARLDFDTYGRLTSGDDNSAPLFIPGRKATLDRAPASTFTTVLLEHGSPTKLTPISRAEALGELVGASFLRKRSVDLGQLLSRGAFRLIWREPNEAWMELERLAP